MLLITIFCEIWYANTIFVFAQAIQCMKGEFQALQTVNGHVNLGDTSNGMKARQHSLNMKIAEKRLVLYT